MFLFTLYANAMVKETTFDQKLFNKAQSEGKVIIISSWIKYCSSCAGQMKILNKAKNDGKLGTRVPIRLLSAATKAICMRTS